MNNKGVLIAAAIVLVLAGAAGGFFGSRLVGGGPATTFRGSAGAFAQLSDSERQQLQNMTDEERTAFFKEKGIDVPAGGPVGGAPGGVRGGRFGLLQGKVAAMDAETLTVQLDAGGSQKVYLDDSTINATEAGASALAVGSKVMVSATPEADGVNTAQLVVVLK